MTARQGKGLDGGDLPTFRNPPHADRLRLSESFCTPHVTENITLLLFSFSLLISLCFIFAGVRLSSVCRCVALYYGLPIGCSIHQPDGYSPKPKPRTLSLSTSRQIFEMEPTGAQAYAHGMTKN